MEGRTGTVGEFLHENITSGPRGSFMFFLGARCLLLQIKCKNVVFDVNYAVIIFI